MGKKRCSVTFGREGKIYCWKRPGEHTFGVPQSPRPHLCRGCKKGNIGTLGFHRRRKARYCRRRLLFRSNSTDWRWLDQLAEVPSNLAKTEMKGDLNLLFRDSIGSFSVRCLLISINVFSPRWDLFDQTPEKMNATDS